MRTSLIDDNDGVHMFVTHFLINHTNARDVFIECSHQATLCVVALDKAHIHVQHGTSFRSKIRALQVHFFAKIFGNHSWMKRPWMIAMTATLPNMYLAPLCRLLTIPLFHAGSILRGSESDGHAFVWQRGSSFRRG